jgi:hypothetical protein
LGLLLYIASKSLITLSTKAFCLSVVKQSTKKSPDPSYSKHNESDAQCFKRLFERRKPVIGGKEVVIWTMQQLLAGSSFSGQTINKKVTRSIV